MSLNMQNMNGWQVLLVDDEPDNLEVVADSLEFFGMSVRTARNGQLALDVLKDWLPDVILLDLSMPVMDGWGTLRHLKSDDRLKSIPVLALSAHAIIGDSKRALDAGFDGYMTKPVNVPTLLQDMRAALQNVPVKADTPAEPVTAQTPAESVTAEAPAESVTVQTSAEPVTAQIPAEPVTVQAPAEVIPAPAEPPVVQIIPAVSHEPAAEPVTARAAAEPEKASL